MVGGEWNPIKETSGQEFFVVAVLRGNTTPKKLPPLLGMGDDYNGPIFLISSLHCSSALEKSPSGIFKVQFFNSTEN